MKKLLIVLGLAAALTGRGQTNTNAPATNSPQTSVNGIGVVVIDKTNLPTLMPLPEDTNWVLRTRVEMTNQWVSIPYGSNVYQVQITISNLFLLSRYIGRDGTKIVTNEIASDIVLMPLVPMRVREGFFTNDTYGQPRLAGYREKP